MAGLSRYNVSDEQAGLEGPVLRNQLNIVDPDELLQAETLLLNDAFEHFFALLEKEELRLNAETIFEIHHYTFNTLYNWAGELRTVDVSKDSMLFAPVAHLKTSVEDMRAVINQQLPLETDDVEAIAEKLAVIHNEFNAVHPFRDGNGRVIRLFIDLSLIAIGHRSLDYSGTRDDYLAACVAGMSANHKPMREIFEQLLRKK